jgi:hypothetical protein
MLLLALFLSPTVATAKNGSEPLNHYGLTTLQDSATGLRLAARFKAKGLPVFLIHDPNIGLMQGDIMRFQDKAVLVDADVWQTLQDEGALGHLRVAPLVRVQAKAAVPTWETRAKLVTSPSEKKAYLLGAELLKILEENFGGIPSRQQMTIVFDGSSLVLIAPSEFLEQLRYAAVRKVAPSGAPALVSPPPERSFSGRPFRWQAWGADPSEPSGTLRYSLYGELPKGLAWDAATHTLKGATDLEGKWPLIAEVRNQAGAFDTMGFTLSMRKNIPPVLAKPPKSVAVVNQLWSFTAEAVDPDHEGSQIHVTPLHMPPGMEFDSVARRFQWYPPPPAAGHETELALRLEDPAGGISDSRHPIKIIAASNLLWSEGVKVSLPWDTLQQGKTYFWEAGASAMAWAQQGITLLGISGDDTTEYHDGSLRLRPAQPGAHTLVFSFDVLGKKMDQKVELPVRPNSPPRFASELGSWRLGAGQHASYRPVAVDADNDPVMLDAVVPQEGPMRWTGERLELQSEDPGTYAARLLASDPAGHGASQWVAYKVEPAERRAAWFLESRVEAGMTALIAACDLGTGRLGVFAPSLSRVGRIGPGRRTHDWPYLFFGGNLLGRKQEKLGRRLWTDAGITLRMPDSKLLSGGFFARVLAEWTVPGAYLSQVEFESQWHANQAMVITDTSGIQAAGNGILQFASQYQDAVQDIFAAATERENIVIFSRLEAWSYAGAGFWAGPGVWREDIPNERRYEQRIGGGLRYRLHLADAIATNTLRAGWGGDGTGWSIYWTGRISVGAPF